MLKIADFGNFAFKYLGPQIFPGHAEVSSKYSLVSHIGVVIIFLPLVRKIGFKITPWLGFPDYFLSPPPHVQNTNYHLSKPITTKIKKLPLVSPEMFLNCKFLPCFF